jgi:peptidoglycan/LPS O-acetylase OafA/YrhL
LIVGRLVAVTNSKYIDELQALRGIAAFAVMIGHCLIYYQNPPWLANIAALFNGRSAVVVFFVLSGYVLTRSWQGSVFDRTSIVRFYLQRAFRIYPAIWVASVPGLIYLCLLHWRIPVSGTSAFFDDRFHASRFNTFFIVASLAGAGSFILPQLWSVCIEIIASVAIPGIAFTVMHRRGLAFGILTVSLIISFAFGNYTYYHISLYFVDFVVGAFIAMPGNLIYRVSAVLPARAIFSVSLLGLVLSQYIPLDYYSPTVHLCETLLAAVGICILVAAKTRISVMKSGPLLFLGDISYSIYLLHFVILCMLAKALAVAESSLGFVLSGASSSISVTVGTVAVTVPLAWLSYRWVERPGIRIGKIVIGWLQSNHVLLLRAAR